MKTNSTTTRPEWIRRMAALVVSQLPEDTTESLQILALARVMVACSGSCAPSPSGCPSTVHVVDTRQRAVDFDR